MRLLVGLLQPTSGTITIAGHDIEKDPLQAKKRFGYLAQTPYVYEKLTGREFLHYLGGIHQLKSAEINQRSERWLNLFSLSDKADQLIGSYSGGMQRKIALCGALLHQPDVLILDEPFAGLDPLSARHVKDMMTELCQQGKTVLISSHTLEIVERICTRIGIINHGQLIAEGTFAELQQNSHASLETLFLQLTTDAHQQEMVDAL